MRPNWYLTWLEDISRPGEDGVTHRFRLRIGDHTSIHIVECGRTKIAEFLNQTAQYGWDEKLAGLALCATRIKEKRNVFGPPEERLEVLNNHSGIKLDEAKKLLVQDEIDLDS